MSLEKSRSLTVDNTNFVTGRYSSTPAGIQRSIFYRFSVKSFLELLPSSVFILLFPENSVLP